MRKINNILHKERVIWSDTLIEEINKRNLTYVKFNKYKQKVDGIQLGDYYLYVGNEKYLWKFGTLLEYKDAMVDEVVPLRYARKVLEKYVEEIHNEVKKAIDEYQECNNNKFYVPVDKVCYSKNMDKFIVLN